MAAPFLKLGLEGWASDWETFPSADGTLQLFSAIHHSETWQSEKALFVLHGLGEHGGRYAHFPYYLTKAGAPFEAVYCLDQRGHGRSEGIRGHVDRFDSLTEDCILAIHRFDESLKKRFGKSEIHLFGHSMGGLVVLRALFRKPDLPIRSVTVSAPLLGIRVELPISKRAVAHVLSHVWGSLHMKNEVDPALLSHDKDVVEAYKADRLVHNKGTPRFYTELLAALADTRKRDSGLEYPLQMIVPMQDRIVDPQAALSFFRALKSRDKQLKTYPDFYHESFNEIGKEQAFEDLSTWIKTHSVS